MSVDNVLTNLAIDTTYEVGCNTGNFTKFFNRIKVVCYKSDDNSLSYKPSKVVVVVKSLNNFKNPRVDDSYLFKKEVNIKYDATTAIVGNFPNGTAFLEQLLSVDASPKTWDDYYVIGSND